ncbi:hypothetical protein Pint_28505 [Pistacia integerrima]|uniref:Uncharacterized protein n=1 Tax=Pistacia integerrima TaxID=434235 RepID=A0ACC0YNV3_9ROSI|nr:hypothetical protein Pint_28505 [Pistacia integerrima]
MRMLGVVINLSGKSSISINLFLGFLLVVDLKVRNPKIKAKREVKKVKLKVDGVTRTIQANLTANGVTGGGSSKNSQSPDDSRPRQKQNLQGISDDSLSPLDKRSGLQGIPWKDFSRVRFSLGKEDQLTGKSTGKNSFGKKGDHSGAVRKSKRVSKRRAVDGEFDDDEDDEIRYLEKLKTSKLADNRCGNYTGNGGF